MNADDPILLERRCDRRIPQLGLVCALPAGHDGDHMAEADPAALGEHLERLVMVNAAQRAAIAAGQRYVAVLKRAARRHTVTIAVLSVLLLVNLGLRVAGL